MEKFYPIMMENVHEYHSGYYVFLTESYNHLVIKAYNDCGNNWTCVDIKELLDWVKKNKPELML